MNITVALCILGSICGAIYAFYIAKTTEAAETYGDMMHLILIGLVASWLSVIAMGILHMVSLKIWDRKIRKK